MRSLVFDFDLSILWPLILLSLIVFGNSIHVYAVAKEDCKRSVKRLSETGFATKEAGEEYLEWARGRVKDRRKSVEFVRYSALTLMISITAMLAPDRWKVELMYWVSSGLGYFSAAMCFSGLAFAWHYARKLDWLRVGICLAVVVVALGSAEHFIHQEMNARRITCPHCTDDDSYNPADEP